MNTKSGLAQIFTSMDARDFLANIWEKSLFHENVGQPDRFERFISLPAVERMLHDIDFRASDLRMVKVGEEISPYQYTVHPRRANYETKADDYLVNKEAVYSLYAHGYSISIHAVDRFLPDLVPLKNALIAELNTRITFNLYLSPPLAEGLNAHWDPHDVCLLQFHGSKDWEIFEADVELPCEPFLKSQSALIGPCRQRMRLDRGDALYFPRGTVHKGKAGEEGSAHLTVGIHPCLWSDVLAEAIEVLKKEEPALRRSIPVLDGSVKTSYQSLLSRLQDPALMAKAIHNLKDRHQQAIRPSYLPRLSNFNKLHLLSLHSWFRRSQGHVRILPRASTLALVKGDTTVEFPLVFEALLTAIFHSEVPFQGHALPKAGLTDEQVLAVLNFMLKDNWIELIEV